MRIGILSDIHGNLEALKSVLSEIDVDDIYCLGDSIGIGPYPKEVLELLLKHQVTMLIGNHEQYYLMDDVDMVKAIDGEGEIIHQRWVKEDLGESYKTIISDFPLYMELSYGNINLYLSHYALKNGQFKSILSSPSGEDLFNYFDGKEDTIYVFGHHHPKHDYQYRGCRFLNPGALGCGKDSYARYLVIELNEDSYQVYFKKCPYNKEKTLNGLDERDVPEKEFIKKIFLGINESVKK